MEKLQLKPKITTISLILILTFSSIIIAFPTVIAQDMPRKVTYAFIGAVPNPVGINQPVLLHVGISDQLSSTELGWENLTVTVRKPDGSTETLGPFRTDSTGGTGTTFTPTLIGSYYLQTHFPQQTALFVPFFGGDPVVQIFEADQSEELELVVQADPITYYPESPLPTEYWTRPIDAQHREWSRIAGNWVDIPPNRDAPYNDDAPESAHILWTKPIESGGLVGGNLGNHAYADGDAYQGKFGASVIINGILYYNRYWTGFVSAPPQQGIFAVDLRTGQQLWFKNNSRLAFGQTFYFSSVNQHSAYAYIWETIGSTWKAYNAYTGEWVYTMENVPAGTKVYGPDGEILKYIVNSSNGWMALWNSTAVASGGFGFFTHSWEPEGSTYDASTPNAYSWNVSIPTDLPGVSYSTFANEILIGSNVTSGSFGFPANDPITSWGINLKPGHEGQLVFKKTWQPPAGNISIQWGTASVEDGIFVFAGKENRAIFAFSIETGDYLFTTETQPYLDFYTFGEQRAIPRAISISDGKIFSCGVAGILYCIDAVTGNTLWTYEATDVYSEILWANNWWINIMFVTDGKIYLTHDEHSPIDPKPRGAPFICIDIESGEAVWKIDGAFRGTQWGGSAIIGDGIIATMNTYDTRIYAVGKGPSAISVEVPIDVIPQGSSITIRGMITDISAGTQSSALTSRFPHGVPAVSDESMSEWMKYVYMQFPMPTQVTGVEVILEAVDPTGHFFVIDKVVSDGAGMFKKMWKPETQGEYTIIARFAGSKSYWPSYAESAISVGPAPDPYPTVTIPPYPGYQGPSASEVAQNVVSSLPEGVSADEVAQEILAQMPDYPETPEYRTSDIIIIILIAVAIIIGIVSYMALRKKN